MKNKYKLFQYAYRCVSCFDSICSFALYVAILFSDAYNKMPKQFKLVFYVKNCCSKASNGHHPLIIKKRKIQAILKTLWQRKNEKKTQKRKKKEKRETKQKHIKE